MNLADIDADRMVRRLGDLVGIETPTGHTPGMHDCFALLRQWLEPALGSPGEVLVEDGVPHLLWTPPRPRVLLLCHVDTVWPLGTLADRPFAVDGERATGPGCFDMKAGLVIAAEALAALKAASDTDHIDHVGVLVTTDEEQGSVTSRAIIERVAPDYQAVLVIEPGLRGALKTSRKGVGTYRFAITGRAAHAGLEPETGINALSELAKLIPRVEQIAAPDKSTTVTPTLANAGTTTNTVPAYATLNADVRAWTADELNRVDQELRALCPRDDAAELEIFGGINRPPMEPGQSRSLVALAQKTAADLGLDPITEASVGGGSDGNITANVGVPTLDGLGPVGDGAHAAHEWVHLPTLPGRALLLAGMLRTLRTSDV